MMIEPILEGDVRWNIVQYLDPTDVARASSVCRRWRLIMSNEGIWKKFFEEDCPPNQASVWRSQDTSARDQKSWKDCYEESVGAAIKRIQRMRSHTTRICLVGNAPREKKEFIQEATSRTSIKGEGTLPNTDNEGVLQFTSSPDQIRVQIVVTSDEPEEINRTLFECNHADAIMMMLQCDNPSSLEELKTFWLPKVTEAVPRQIPIKIVANFRSDLVEEELKNITSRFNLDPFYNQPFTNLEISKLLSIDFIPDTLMLFSSQRNVTQAVTAAFKAIFRSYDVDKDDRLDEKEWNSYIFDVFGPWHPTSLRTIVDIIANRDGVDSLPPFLTLPMFVSAFSNPKTAFPLLGIAPSFIFAKMGVLDLLWLSYLPFWHRRTQKDITDFAWKIIQLQDPQNCFHNAMHCVEKLKIDSRPKSLVHNLSHLLGMVTNNNIGVDFDKFPDESRTETLSVLLRLLQIPETDLLALTALSVIFRRSSTPKMIASYPGLWPLVAKLLPKGSRYMQCASSMTGKHTGLGEDETLAKEITGQLFPVLATLLLEQQISPQMEASAKVLLHNCCVLLRRYQHQANVDWLTDALVLKLVQDLNLEIAWIILSFLAYYRFARQILARHTLDETFAQIRRGNARAVNYFRFFLSSAAPCADDEAMEIIRNRTDFVRSFSEGFERGISDPGTLMTFIRHGGKFSAEDISDNCLEHIILYAVYDSNSLRLFEQKEVMMDRIMEKIAAHSYRIKQYIHLITRMNFR
eukprot:TRINITY_DN6791_c0_g1_i1.p1 TRINITY_DN6791_c0_g1~~TRINITY_DN6791_c0_g1_i1.p1  ORF type:complete len:745 (-),score=62.18 TRINITY_DN6791_c0_g1_i1:277-2511(-)